MRLVLQRQLRRPAAGAVRASASSRRGEKNNVAPLPTASRRDALLLLGASTAAATTIEAPLIASAEPPPPAAAAATASSPPPPSSAPAAVTRAPAAALTPRERDAVAAYELSSPSVVNVFDLYLVRGGGVAFGSGAAEAEGNGSGVLWRDPATSALVVVTNYHVVGSSLERVKEEDIGGIRSPGPVVARVVAQAPDGKRRALDAAVVGIDRSHDLAVLVLLGGPPAAPAAPAAPASAGGFLPGLLRPIERSETASTLRVGQQVFALGNPFGFELTFTGGLVSGISRSFESKVSAAPSSSSSSSSAAAAANGRSRSGGAAAGPSVISGAIQHSAPINPGSSGGPLLDSRGRLVGLSTAIFTVRPSSFLSFVVEKERRAKGTKKKNSLSPLSFYSFFSFSPPHRTRALQWGSDSLFPSICWKESSPSSSREAGRRLSGPASGSQHLPSPLRFYLPLEGGGTTLPSHLA